MRQVIKPEQLEVLMGIYSERDLPLPTREAVRMRIVNGATYEWCEMMTGVSRQRVAKAVDKLEQAHEKIKTVYGL
ncbi:hypothetical protein ACN08P_11115 [Photobacterium leiognathi subsp. mandapamensis]|uniref:hypothetical protein n=1 Tax=Photobacterium leiognathi TaxID=553611 RepID=UPI003AF3E8C4